MVVGLREKKTVFESFTVRRRGGEAVGLVRWHRQIVHVWRLPQIVNG